MKENDHRSNVTQLISQLNDRKSSMQRNLTVMVQENKLRILTFCALRWNISATDNLAPRSAMADENSLHTLFNFSSIS